MPMVLQANLPWDRRVPASHFFSPNHNVTSNNSSSNNPHHQHLQLQHHILNNHNHIISNQRNHQQQQQQHLPPQTQDAFGLEPSAIKYEQWSHITHLPPASAPLFHPLQLTTFESRTLQQQQQQLTQQVVPRSQTHISALYPEILAIIFSYLDVPDKGRAAQVCKAWRDAAYHKTVWRGVEAKLHVRHGITRTNATLFPSLVRRGIKKVQVLSLKRNLKDVVQGVPNLETLNLIGCFNLTDSLASAAFSNQISSLQSLNLSMCKQISDNSIGKIAGNLQSLETLDLGGCSGITNGSLMLISYGLKRLKNLNLRSCRNISDQGLSELAGLGPQSRNGGVTSLETLSLQDCQKLSDEALGFIAAGLTNLKTINLSFCASVSDVGMKHLAKMVKLRELNLRSCDNISDMGMAYLAEGGSRVTALDVSFCDKIGDQGLLHISQGLGRLTSLSLGACPVSDEGLRRVAKTLTHLKTLNIGQCVRVTDVGLTSIAEGLRNLESIDLYGCTKISAAGLKKIMEVKGLLVLNLELKLPDSRQEEGSLPTSCLAPRPAKRKRASVEYSDCRGIKSSRMIEHRQNTATTNYMER